MKRSLKKAKDSYAHNYRGLN
jgi:hypothetical protein